MALDVGERRIGVALSDETELIASSVGAILRTPEKSEFGEILALINKYRVGTMVVGLPLSLDGTIGPQARAVQAFIEALRRVTQITIESRDERFTTVEAERLLREAGVRPSRDKPRIDAVAAAILLQAYLDSRRNETY